MIAFDIKFEHIRSGFNGAQVCVIVTSYNYGHYIEGALGSLVIQSLTNFNLVIVDDHSTDDSCNIIRNFLVAHQGRFQSISLLRTRENIGPGQARNLGIKYLPSKYYFFLDADNILFPHCLARHVEALDYSDAQFAYAISAKFGDSDKCLSYQPWSEERLQKSNYIDMMSMVRGEWLNSIGAFSSNKWASLGWEDYDLWCKFAEMDYSGVQVPEILARYRVSRHSMLRATTYAEQNKPILAADMHRRHPWLTVFSDLLDD